jgi:hypothetical protein
MNLWEYFNMPQDKRFKTIFWICLIANIVAFIVLVCS